MKFIHVIALAVSLLPVAGRCDTVSCGEIYDMVEKKVDVLYAEKSEINKVFPWKPGRDKDLMPMKDLVALAESRVKLPAKSKVEMMTGVSWRRTNMMVWYVEIVFHCVPKLVPGKIPVRDGDFLVTIRMLPNGAQITTRTREMTRKDLYGEEKADSAIAEIPKK